jgi:hypothetical protein
VDKIYFRYYRANKILSLTLVSTARLLSLVQKQMPTTMLPGWELIETRAEPFILGKTIIA